MKQYKFKSGWVFAEALVTVLLYTVALTWLFQAIIETYWTNPVSAVFICISIVAIGILHFRTINQIFKDMSKYKSVAEIKLQ